MSIIIAEKLHQIGNAKKYKNNDVGHNNDLGRVILV